MLNLRPEVGQVRADFDRTLRIGRLQTLQRYGLADGDRAGRVGLVREAGADTARLGRTRRHYQNDQSRAYQSRRRAGVGSSYVLHGEQALTPIVGRVIGKGLTDELGERLALIVDGVDGRVHHVAVGEAAAIEEAKIGTIVEIAPLAAPPRPADRNIAAS